MYLINHTHIDTFMDETLEYFEQNVIGRGTLRLANEDDLEFVAKAMYQFEKDTGLNRNPDKDRCFELAKVRMPEGNIFIWEDEGKAVSLAAKTRPTKNGVTVNFVYTPKSH